MLVNQVITLKMGKEKQRTKHLFCLSHINGYVGQPNMTGIFLFIKSIPANKMK